MSGSAIQHTPYGKPDISFVCAVESGGLESQTVRLIESLRRFGGRFKDADLFAVTPRFGPPLARATRRLFERYGVHYIRTASDPRYAWFNFYNKPLALVAAEPQMRTSVGCFLDSDLLIVREPNLLQLAADEDFLGTPIEIKEMGTTGPGDPFEGLWRAAGAAVGVDVESLPWMITGQSMERIRLYFNGGLMVYRRDTGFARSYLDTTTKLLDSHIGTRAKDYSEGFKEMVSILFATRLLGLRCRELPLAYNYPMSKVTHQQLYSEAGLRDARIVHYHGSMWPEFWDPFQQCMAKTHPAVHAWLEGVGPMSNDAAPPYKLLSQLLRRRRVRKSHEYTAACQPAREG